jgi:hypothetical protein
VDGFHWVVIAVYGAAQVEHKESFTGLVQTCAKETGPALVDGVMEILISLQVHRKRTTIYMRIGGPSCLMLS